MKANKWLGFITAMILPFFTACAQIPATTQPAATVAAAPAPAPAPAVSPTTAEVVKMAEAGTSDEVLLAYIKNSTSLFELSADQILYLRDIGLTSPVITAMLSRDSELRAQTPSVATAPPNPPASAPEQTPGPEAAQQPPGAVEAPLVPPPTYVSSPPPDVGYFYDDLAPYGSWVQLEGVGWCWQPRVVVVNHTWRPYCDSGHWVYTDAGWFWQSEYSWGWAPFHYGRWYLHDRCGWVWTPDRIWGPAWVTWRSEGEHCGWAPLPPHAEFDVRLGYRFNGVHVAVDFDFGLRPDHFTFIALHDFHDHDFAHHRLPPTQVTQIYNHTTIINNYVVNNNTVVNQGIKVDRVAAATHTEIKKVAIRDTPAGSPAVTNPRLSAKGELAVYRPQLKAPQRPVNMVAQKVDDRHPVIQHAPVVPAKAQRPFIAGSTSSSLGNRSPQGQPQPAPNAYRSGNSGTASTPPVNHSQPTKPVSPSNTPAARPGQDRSESARSAPLTPQPGTGGQYYPRSGSSLPDNTRPSARPDPGTYYPKGYYQSGEARPAPPANSARPSDSRGQSSVNSRPGGSSDSGNRGQGGQSRKNDQ